MNPMRRMGAGALAVVLALAIGTTGGATFAQGARPVAGTSAGTGAGKEADHRKDDIGRHRAMAAAHDAAARCLERGEQEAVCHEALRKACQGIAVGRYCGMKHSH